MDLWFLLQDGPASGAENMARDEFLLDRAGRIPVLRLYMFHPPALTIGYHQDPARILDPVALEGGEVDVVRRITGGRALLHEGELTYSVSAGRDSELFGAGLLETYMKISEALREALRSLGVEAVISRGRAFERAGGPDLPCLVSACRYEITVGGRKIAGSAQRRGSAAFLQHGSILIGPGSAAIANFLKGEWDFLESRTTCVSEQLGRGVAADEMGASLKDAFTSVFGITWMPLRLSPGDEREIARRELEKRLELTPVPGREVGG